MEQQSIYYIEANPSITNMQKNTRNWL